MTGRAAIIAALAAALLFGASTPFAKVLVSQVSPLMLAGFLYLGSGIGLWAIRLVRDRGFTAPALLRRERFWFAGAVVSGGAIGPVLLLYGLTKASASDASLLLNLESVFTALLAWIVFREHADRRIVFGMALIVCGGAVLAWPRDAMTGGSLLGELAIAGACLCWALDNNLTRKVSGADAMFIASTKGLAAGATNCILALTFGAVFPAPTTLAAAMIIGLFGYGFSLVLFVVALRGLGAARTGAYFSTAPFLGAAIALALFREPATNGFWVAALLMAGGVWLHLTERHDHEHSHEAMTHTHAHVHDAHHVHEHEGSWDGVEPHTHEHSHEPLTHRHPHYPDLHHQHGHSHRD